MPIDAFLTAPYTAALLLPEGKIFYGYGIGTQGLALGEICFNTAMTGYQEILTDPSYDGQIITFTTPHIGNVGTNGEDIESSTPRAAGLIVREAITSPSNFRSNKSLGAWLEERGITGISGIDTRALTRSIRLHGANNVAIFYPAKNQAMTLDEARAALQAHPSLEGAELAEGVSTNSTYPHQHKRFELGIGYPSLDKARRHVVVIDYGTKTNILRSLASAECRTTIVPCTMPAEEILALAPDGILLSNGPGDPAATAAFAVPIIQALMQSQLPIFGICLGHQLLALALGAKTEKMHQGHRGANHPIKNLKTEKIEITSQNHGFVVSANHLPDCVEVTHCSLFDGTIAGIRHKEKPAFSVQYHPESSPGPHDSLYLFNQFAEMMDLHAKTH